MVFLTALLVRLWVLCAVSNTPDFLPEHGDMKFYSDWARRIAAGTWTDHQAFYGLPGYAYWLALVYGLFGFQPYVAVLFQVVAEAFTCTVIFKIAALAFASEGSLPRRMRAAPGSSGGWPRRAGCVSCPRRCIPRC